MFLGRRADGNEIPGQEDVDHLGQHAGRAEVLAELVPAAGLHAGFFREFSHGALERRLTAVQLPGRQLVQPPAGRVPELVQQADAPLGVEGHDRGPARVMRDLEFGHPAVRKRHLLEVERQYAPFENVADLLRHVEGAGLPKARDHTQDCGPPPTAHRPRPSL